MNEGLGEALAAALGSPVTQATRLAGGASKEAWAVSTADGRELLLRRAGGGVMHLDSLSLRQEFDVLVAAHAAGVRVPEPIEYLGELDGREAFVMELVDGEAIGRRIVKAPPPGLDIQMAEQLAAIHAVAPSTLPFLASGDLWVRLYAELDSVDEPHPAIEYGLAWCRERLPLERPPVVCHGDFRIGNLMVDGSGIVAVLDWEFAHLSDPAEDLAWPLVRAWRFGNDANRLGGIAPAEPFLDRYAELTGVRVPPDELLVWEVLGNCKWAIGSLTQARRHLRGEERSVELAILGRLAAEMEYELLDLIEKAAMTDRPTAAELAEAVREFLEVEILPTLDDHRLRFRTLVAMNALSIVEREAAPAPTEPDWALARRIRAGDIRDTDLAALKASVTARLEIASPKFLERYRSASEPDR